MAQQKKTFCFDTFTEDKRAQIEQSVKDAGYKICAHFANPGGIRIIADKRESLTLLWATLESIAPGIKLRGPM